MVEVGGFVVHDPREHLPQRGEVTVGAGDMAGVVQLGLVDQIPPQATTGLGQQLVEELPLRAAVALPERVGEVDVVVHVGELVRQLPVRDGTQEIGGGSVHAVS